MTFLQIATLKRPFRRIKNVSELYFEVLNGARPEELELINNRNHRALIEACICREEIRPSASELLRLPFFRDLDGDFERIEDLSTTGGSANFGRFKGTIERFCLLNEAFRESA
jgi:hypothetical protein